MMNKVKVIEDNLDYDKSHISWRTTLKVYDPEDINYMIFRISINICNGNHSWNIYVWSPNNFQWNSFANAADIQGMNHLSYIDSCSYGTNDLNPKARENYYLMMGYIKRFCEEL